MVAICQSLVSFTKGKQLFGSKPMSRRRQLCLARSVIAKHAIVGDESDERNVDSPSNRLPPFKCYEPALVKRNIYGNAIQIMLQDLLFMLAIMQFILQYSIHYVVWVVNAMQCKL